MPADANNVHSNDNLHITIVSTYTPNALHSAVER